MKATAAVAAHDKDINSVAVSPNDQLVASGSQVQPMAFFALWQTRLYLWFVCAVVRNDAPVAPGSQVGLTLLALHSCDLAAL